VRASVVPDDGADADQISEAKSYSTRLLYSLANVLYPLTTTYTSIYNNSELSTTGPTSEICTDHLASDGTVLYSVLARR
jgi:hypothetical protein